MLVLVTGATGFVGRRVVAELLKRHHQVRCYVHTPGRERMFTGRSVEVRYGSVSDSDALAEALTGVEAVVHLVGIIRQTPRSSFDLINRQGTADVVNAAKNSGVKHFVQLSAIGAGEDPQYAYLLSKWRAEQELVNSGLSYTILRSSVMFGEGDEFLNALAAMVRVLPILPVVGSGRNRFQPIAVEDVARCVALSLDRGSLRHRTMEIGGPEQLTYNQIVAALARTMGKRRLRLHVPVWLMYLAAIGMRLVRPRPPITTDQLKMLGIRNVAEPDVVEQEFGFTPRGLEGNIDYIKSVGFSDGIKILLGSMPPSVRDH